MNAWWVNRRSPQKADEGVVASAGVAEAWSRKHGLRPFGSTYIFYI
jgi:hypothetical protein